MSVVTTTCPFGYTVCSSAYRVFKDNETVSLGSPTTVHESLVRNDPDDVVLRILQQDRQGASMSRTVCSQFKAFFSNFCAKTCSSYFDSANPPPPDLVPTNVACASTSTSDGKSLFPLHFAIYKRRSIKVIAAILNAFEEAVYRGMYAPLTGVQEPLQKEEEQPQQLPLHWAARYDASPKVVELLIRRYPEALDVQGYNSNTATPRHIARASATLPPESLRLFVKPTSYWLAPQDIRVVGGQNRNNAAGGEESPESISPSLPEPVQLQDILDGVRRLSRSDEVLSKLEDLGGKFDGFSSTANKSEEAREEALKEIKNHLISLATDAVVADNRKESTMTDIKEELSQFDLSISDINNMVASVIAKMEDVAAKDNTTPETANQISQVRVAVTNQASDVRSHDLFQRPKVAEEGTHRGEVQISEAAQSVSQAALTEGAGVHQSHALMWSMVAGFVTLMAIAGVVFVRRRRHNLRSASNQKTNYDASKQGEEVP